MCRRFRSSGFEVSLCTHITTYKLLFKLSRGVYKDYVRAFSWESKEFTDLEEYYGSIFMLHVLPEKYGFHSNVLREKGPIQVRFIDFSPFPIEKMFLKLALAYWRNTNFDLKGNSSSVSAFQELSLLIDSFQAIPIPGFEPVVKETLGQVRKDQAVLVLLEPNGVLFCRSEEEVKIGNKEGKWDWFIGGKYYYLRPDTQRFLEKLQAHPRCLLGFYSSLSQTTCAAVFPLFAPSVSFYSSQYCDRRVPYRPQKELRRIWRTSFALSQGMEERNTVLVESEYERCEGVKQGLVLVPAYGRHEVVSCRSKVPLQHLCGYLLDVLTHSNYDVRAYMDSHPFTAYT